MAEVKNIKTPQDRVQDAIDIITNGKSRIFFFVFDTKGQASGCLQYIYGLAKIAKDAGHNVTMLYQADEKNPFVGVKDWLGEEFANLPHADVSDEGVALSASDVLFIPELFSNVMVQTKKLPCKRIAILQSMDFLVDQMPIGAQWGDFGIFEAVVNTADNARKLKELFPYVRTHVIDPYISNMFGETNTPKRLEINIMSQDPFDIKRIVKPFYLKYPGYRWVSFKDIRGMSKEMVAQQFRESPLTIWVDRESNFGYTALEAVKSGSCVIGWLPQYQIPWAFEEINTEDGKTGIQPSQACLWFDSFERLHPMIASFVRAWITDSVPEGAFGNGKDIAAKYTEENTASQFIQYLSNKLDERKQELEHIRDQFPKNNEETKE